MQPTHPCGGVRRREFLSGIAAASAAIGTGLAAQHASAQALRAKAAQTGEGLGVPGPYPGRVVEVRNPALIRDGVRSAEAVKAAVARGMSELTGADDGTSAWRRFFEPGDVVGVKVVPNGFPMAPTSSELILAVIDGLVSAGVKKADIIVFDRYEGEFRQAGMDKILPDGVRWGFLTPDEPGVSQLDVAFDSKNPLCGYDPDEFMTMNLVAAGDDPKDDRTYRSHLGLLVTRHVNKIIGLPCLKDHGSAGVTGALKNMSHGLVNNVARSHSTPDTNACNQFIPQSASHPITRQKCVLQILDGARGIWQGGPFGPDEKFSWEYNALLFATDPVAMDHIAWDILDAKRKVEGVPGVGAVGKIVADPFGREGFDVRQPQHVALAANLGLGIFDKKSPQGRRKSLHHQVVEMDGA